MVDEAVYFFLNDAETTAIYTYYHTLSLHDALPISSMSTVVGYKAVLAAAEELPKMFPMLMTATGTIKPARIFVIGAGIVGLQAIATARRLGRSEEHTSALQSLMRRSYAAFCLKKTTQTA